MHRPISVPARRTRCGLVVGSLIAILAGGWLAIVTQPTALVTTAWWPAAGIALGLGIRFPRKYVWFLALAVCLVDPAGFAVGGTTGAAGRGAVDRRRHRDGHRDTDPAGPRRSAAHPGLSPRYRSVVGGGHRRRRWSTTFGRSGAAFALGDRAGAWTRLVTAVPKHAAGMLLLTPLFMQHPRRPRQAGPFETATQIAVTLTVAALVFVFNPGAERSVPDVRSAGLGGIADVDPADAHGDTGDCGDRIVRKSHRGLGPFSFVTCDPEDRQHPSADLRALDGDRVPHALPCRGAGSGNSATADATAKTCSAGSSMGRSQGS